MKTYFNDKWKKWIRDNLYQGKNKDSIFKILIDEGYDYNVIKKEMKYEPKKRVDELLNPHLEKKQIEKSKKEFSLSRFPRPASFFDRDGREVSLLDRHLGSSIFLIAGGPSLNKLDITLLDKPGVMKMGMNNSPVLVRPQIWTHTDGPDQFLRSIWADPTILKLSPRRFVDTKIWCSYTYREMPLTVGDCPNVLFYERNQVFNAETFLSEPTFNWGNYDDHYVICPKTGDKLNGYRSTMLVAIKSLVLMGFKKIYLVGVDFNMDKKNPYAFKQNKPVNERNAIMKSYRALNIYFDQLRPKMEALGVSIYNTNPESGLKTFETMDFNTAIRRETSFVGDISLESTEKMYDPIQTKLKKVKGMSLLTRGKQEIKTLETAYFPK